MPLSLFCKLTRGVMASYIDNALNKNEKIIARAKISWWSQLGVIIIGLFLTLFYGIGLIILIYVLIKVKTTELALTSQRMIAKIGFISRNTVELRLEKVESLSIHQNFDGRILGYGTIVIKGTGGTQTPIPSIKNPMGFRKIFNEYLEDKKTEI